MDNPNPERVVNSCSQHGEKGETSIILFEDQRGIGMHICARSNNLNVANTLDTSKGVGTLLQDLEMKSLTFIHEFYHASTRGSQSADQPAWLPPADVPIRNKDGTLNTAWPGPPERFVNRGGQAG